MRKSVVVNSASGVMDSLAEVSRVLRPGGIFVVFDIPDGWIHRVSDIKIMSGWNRGALLLRAVLPE